MGTLGYVLLSVGLAILYGGMAFGLYYVFWRPVIAIWKRRKRCSNRVVADYDHEEKIPFVPCPWKIYAHSDNLIRQYVIDEIMNQQASYRVYYRYKVDGKEYVETDHYPYNDAELAAFGKSMMIRVCPEDPTVVELRKPNITLPLSAGIGGAVMILFFIIATVLMMIYA